MQRNRKRPDLSSAELKARGYKKKTLLLPVTLAKALAYRSVDEERTETAIVIAALQQYLKKGGKR
jgi:hypothetical protein